MRQLVTKEWEQRGEVEDLHAAIIFTLSHTKGLVWKDPSMVDATVSKAALLNQLQASLPLLQNQIAAIKAMAVVGDVDGEGGGRNGVGGEGSQRWGWFIIAPL